MVDIKSTQCNNLSSLKQNLVRLIHPQALAVASGRPKHLR
jgi:hypothetical protein